MANRIVSVHAGICGIGIYSTFTYGWLAAHQSSHVIIPKHVIISKASDNVSGVHGL